MSDTEGKGVVIADATSFVTREIMLLLKVRVTLSKDPQLELEVRDAKSHGPGGGSVPMVVFGTVPRRSVMLAHGWALGEKTRDALDRLAISRATHRRLTRDLFDRMGVDTRGEAVALLVENGMVSRSESLRTMAQVEAEAEVVFEAGVPDESLYRVVKRSASAE